MKKKIILLSSISIILILLTFSLFMISKYQPKYDIIMSDEFSSSYEDKVSDKYKAKTVKRSSYSSYYDRAKAIEMDEYTAEFLLDAGLGIKFIPVYNTKTVLIRNNDKTDVVTKSLNELKESDLNISFDNTNTLTTLLSYMTISKDLYDNYELSNSINYLKSIKNLNDSANHLKSDYIITSLIEANNLKNENISVYDIDEGSIECNIGLLIFDNKLDITEYINILNNEGLIIKEFDNTYKCEDINVLGEFNIDRVRLFRRKVKGIYKYSGVNSDERSVILIIFLIFMIPWAISIGIRINDKNIRKAVIICLSMVLSWLVLRYLKSHIANDIMLRYIWYLNYLPLIFAPILFLNANMVMTLDYKKKHKIIMGILLGISSLMLFFVLTNDVTQFAFVFDKGLNEWQSYSYGFLFYIIMAFGFIELIAGIILLLMKNYKQISKYELIAPIVIYILILLYITCDFFGVSLVIEMDYTLMICLLALILWEVTLRCGLVQNCGKYYFLFNTMSFDLAILNKNNKEIYKTEKFGEIPNIDNELSIDNTRYRKLLIHNGYTILKDDLGALDSVKQELNKRQELLEKNNNTLKQEHKIMSEYYSLKSQNDILNELDLDYKLKNEQILELVEKINTLKDKKDIYPYLARIKFLVSYTKQKYNCYINSKINEKVEIQAIALAIHFVMEDAKSLGLDAGLLCNSMELIDSNLSTIILDIIYMMMENAIDNKTDLFANIDVKDNDIIVFGLFNDKSIINIDYFSNSIKSLIESNDITYEIKQNDDMKKFIVKVGRKI